LIVVPGLKNWHQQRAEWTAPPESGAAKVAGSDARAAGREVDPQVRLFFFSENFNVWTQICFSFQLLFDCFRDMKKFPHGVPLSVMVEFLDMVWEEEN
jgi:hypothetical protein